MLPRELIVVCSLVASAAGLVQVWEVDSFPNPTKASGYKECKMQGLSNVCDPDEVFTESERYRLNNELNRMTRRTEKTDGTFCDKRGFEPVLVIMQQGSQKFADGLNAKWNLDGQCRKAVIFLFSADERKLFYSAEPGTDFSAADFTAVVSGQQTSIGEGKFTSSLINIFKQIGGARNIQEGSTDEEQNYKQAKSALLIGQVTPMVLALFLLVILVV
uniref:TPM_phosphatase domain-containing protein n=1 Tax=Steinernema glaseri TaxID=37863 RepID=A0A1I8A7V8_9BILA